MGIKQLSTPLKSSTGKPVPARTGIADALFSNTQQRVLALLFGQPKRSFFTNELIGLVGGGSGAVQREVRRLVESGLVLSTHIGSQKHYQANPAAPIFKELRGIITKTLGPAEVLRASLRPLGDTVRLALVYGSVAKGNDTAHSDIEKRYYCIGEVNGGIPTVRFTYRSSVIRIFGVGYWRKGRTIYERENG